jgi:hypothetical protein
MKSIAIALVLFTASAAHAQTPADPSGHWKGTIEIPGNPMDFDVDLWRDSRGELVGTITAGVDRATGPLIKIALNGRALSFYSRADQPLEAVLSSSGTTMSGMATVSGYSLPFGMTRTGEAVITPPPTNAAVSKELEGVWKGVLAAGTAEYRLVMTIANQPDGRALAQVVSTDEGGMLQYLVLTQNGAKVTIESRGVRSSYTGALNAAGTELSGTWTQGATGLPLTFTKR